MLSLFKHHTSNFSLGVMQQNLVFNLCIYIYIFYRWQFLRVRINTNNGILPVFHYTELSFHEN